MKYQIWYMKPSFLRDAVGSSPDPNNLSATHVHLKDIEAENQEDALSRMRTENWSPNDQALDLLQSKGLQHTTMIDRRRARGRKQCCLSRHRHWVQFATQTYGAAPIMPSNGKSHTSNARGPSPLGNPYCRMNISARGDGGAM
jgi:hypothetical protein